MDVFSWACLVSCFVLPAAVLFWWWRRKVISFDAFTRLEMQASYEEHLARDRLGRVASYERMPTFKSPAPSARPRTDTPAPTWNGRSSTLTIERGQVEASPNWCHADTHHPAPTWARRPEQDDPAPIFDALVQTAIEAAPVVMENVTMVESPSGYDMTPSNDNATAPDSSTFDGGNGGGFGGAGSSGEW